MRQWQAPTLGSCASVTVMVTDPQRHFPVISRVIAIHTFFIEYVSMSETLTFFGVLPGSRGAAGGCAHVTPRFFTPPRFS
ncbi:hypothetical protein [Aquicoccus porphyridii]|uniref:hypothetical protein n=1 Tax=Aquicoccus porphyridii TaxID=1852029 RepID=UPI003F6DF20B